MTHLTFSNLPSPSRSCSDQVCLGLPSILKLAPTSYNTQVNHHDTLTITRQTIMTIMKTIKKMMSKAMMKIKSKANTLSFCSFLFCFFNRTSCTEGVSSLSPPISGASIVVWDHQCPHMQLGMGKVWALRWKGVPQVCGSGQVVPRCYEQHPLFEFWLFKGLRRPMIHVVRG